MFRAFLSSAFTQQQHHRTSDTSDSQAAKSVKQAGNFHISPPPSVYRRSLTGYLHDPRDKSAASLPVALFFFTDFHDVLSQLSSAFCCVINRSVCHMKGCR